MATKIDPRAMYICGVPFVDGSTLAGKSYQRGRRSRGEDPGVVAHPAWFVEESEATTDALDQAYSDHWNATVDPTRAWRAAAKLREENIRVGTRVLGSDSAIAVSAKRMVEAEPGLYELSFDVN